MVLSSRYVTCYSVAISNTARPNGRRLGCPDVARLAAHALVKHSFNATRAAKEIRPHLTEQSARKTGSRMIRTPAVLAELEKLMEGKGLGERNAERFVQQH